MLGSWGLYLNTKTKVLGIVAQGRQKCVYVDKDIAINVNGDEVAAIDSEESWKYLGAEFNSHGLVSPTIDLAGMLSKLGNCSLKTQQKIYLLRVHLIPRLIHVFTMMRLSVKALQTADRLIREFVLRILQLRKDVPKAFLYAAVKHGGMGLMQLRVSIPAIIARRFGRMTSSSAPAIALAASLECNVNRLLKAERLIKEMTIAEVAGDEKDIKCANTKSIQVVHSYTLYSKRDGGALREAGLVPYVHTWISDGTLNMRPKIYRDALRVRTGSLPTLHRTPERWPLEGRSTQCETLWCRLGCHAEETNHHVLQNCEHVQGMRIVRHNRVLQMLYSALLKKGYFVLKEELIPGKGGRDFKPDLIMCKNGLTATVCDVQIVGGGRGYENLADRHHEKRRKYNKKLVRKHLEGLFLGCTKLKFTSLTISDRGIMCYESAQSLLKLGLSKKTLRDLVVASLEGSVRIFQTFSARCQQRNSRREGLTEVES